MQENMSENIEQKIIDTYNVVKINKDLGYTILINKSPGEKDPIISVNIHFEFGDKESEQYLHLINHYHDAIKNLDYQDIKLMTDTQSCTLWGYILNK
jgi:hypothetical protein